MEISRVEAVRRIEGKILQFRKIIEDSNFINLNSNEYYSTHDETKSLIADIFSEAEAEKFQRKVNLPFVFAINLFAPDRESLSHNKEESIKHTKKEIKRCIIELNDYKERVQSFWFNDKIGNEEKIVEKALLLMRFYQEKEIYEIGKKLNLPYFNELNNHEEMSYHRGALEISKAATDACLLELMRENPSKYKPSLGGFQGQFYSATSNGELELESSWGNVRENVQQSLERWGKIAYSVLEAMISKSGTATDIDITDEIEKVLGSGYSWANLLPRLEQRKLVFKRPDYCEMPPEIIPAVQEELSRYKRFANIFSDIIQTRRCINLVFKQKFKISLFKDDEVAMHDIQKSCVNEDDFNNRIQALSTLIDKIETKKLRKFVNSDLMGSINILERFLNIYASHYDRTVIINFRNIMTLRSKKRPVHSDDPKFIEALKYFGFGYPPENWGELWKSVLDGYLESLELLHECLNIL